MLFYFWRIHLVLNCTFVFLNCKLFCKQNGQRAWHQKMQRSKCHYVKEIRKQKRLLPGKSFYKMQLCNLIWFDNMIFHKNRLKDQGLTSKFSIICDKENKSEILFCEYMFKSFVCHFTNKIIIYLNNCGSVFVCSYVGLYVILLIATLALQCLVPNETKSNCL